MEKNAKDRTPSASPVNEAKLPRWAEASVQKNPHVGDELRCNMAADFALRHHPLAKFVRAAIRLVQIQSCHPHFKSTRFCSLLSSSGVLLNKLLDMCSWNRAENDDDGEAMKLRQDILCVFCPPAQVQSHCAQPEGRHILYMYAHVKLLTFDSLHGYAHTEYWWRLPPTNQENFAVPEQQ
eukprot:SAG31_NODE_2779_length_5102_cov_26.673796_1_plen_180_part_00